MMRVWRLSPAWVSMILFVTWLTACNRPAVFSDTPVPPSPQGSDLRAQAAAEATAIVQQAQATALVLRAQAQATALMQQAQELPTALATQALPMLTATPGRAAVEIDVTPAVTETVEATGDAAVVELLGVGFAAEGAFIIANYRAPPQVAQTFWPGVLSVTDEASGTVFSEVPLMPLIGPLIARPVEAGQPGYFMLVHAPAILRSGSRVTVVLGDYTFEHVPVQ